MNSLPAFDRKIYTPRLLFHDLGFFLSHLREIRGAMRNEQIGKAFMEKIMTVVTAVNGCVYCAWFHARQSEAAGISREEVKDLLELQFHAGASEHEVMGLLYAQHYAETDRHPDEEMTAKLIASYGDRTARDIILMIRMIYFGNLSGNTFDAFLSRLRGQKAPHSNLLFELIFFLFSAPILLPTFPAVKPFRQRQVTH
ncbi:MAG: carboxymuconolactone decarboxylase family protein [Lewinellaceae bacterium]|nr:carboxymuconolactone decarboxylase family protein [Lewinellaceae bacterium]